MKRLNDNTPYAANRTSCHCSEYSQEDIKNIDPIISDVRLITRGAIRDLSRVSFITNNYTLKPNVFQLFKNIFGNGALIDISRLSSGWWNDISRE